MSATALTSRLRGLTLSRRAYFVIAAIALGSLAAIVFTGSAVRLTGSGLGCPTWPTCTEDSFVPEGAKGIHEAIEYGNRMLGVVVGLIALAAVVVAWRTVHRRLAIGVLAGVAAQGVIGGITVRMDLNPWTVGVHFLVSVAILVSLRDKWLGAAS